MSTLCGIVNLDEKPVEEAQIQAMNAAAADRTPDGRAHWIRGSVGLGFGWLRTTPESSGCRQPLENGPTQICLCFVGRIDNRDELCHLLESDGDSPRMDSDAELILRSYYRWQERCLSIVLGEFNFAIWDQDRERLLCARDLIGSRPFYYYQSGKSFYFASEIRQLLALPEIPRKPNEGMLGEYLVSRMISKSETQFEGIMRLPPASCLVVKEGQVEVREYWAPAEVPRIRYQHDGEYADHLRELLFSAVDSRIRSQAPVGIQLSGGLDSSSVVAVAAELLRTRGVANPGLETYSLVFPGWGCDESDFIEDVEGRSGFPAHRVTPAPLDRVRYAEQVTRYLDYPDYPNGTMSDSLERVAQQGGVRVLLTGLGGDEWFQRTDLFLADLLRRGRLISAASWLRSLPEWTGSSWKEHPLFVDGIAPLIPEGVKKAFRGRRSGSRVSNWIHPDFARRNDLHDRIRQRLDWSRFGDFSRAGSFLAATQGFQTHAIEMEERSAARFHIELRYPFHDRRIMEFGLGLPPDQRWRNGLHKHVLREAVGDLLPESISQRRTKAEFSRVFVEALLSVGRGSFEGLAIADAGWVDGRVVVEMFDRMERRFQTEGISGGSEIWPLWSIFGTELLYSEVLDTG